MSPLGFLSLGCLLSASGLLVSWATRRYDALGRPRDLPVWSVTVLVVVALVAMVPGAQRAIEERRLARVASTLTGVSVEVRCQSTIAALVDAGSELGWVRFDEYGVPDHETLIKREQCEDLKAYRDGGHTHPTFAQTVAVHVLTHEAMHMRGEAGEAVAECQAVQRDAVTASELGASPAEAFALAGDYWRTAYPRMPDDYASGECRPGGALDEHLQSAPWD